MGAAGDALAEEGLGTELIDALAPDGAIDHDAGAEEAGVEGDCPEPAVLDGLDEDVVGVGLGEPGTARVVAVDGEVAEERVGLAEAAGAPDEARLAAGIDDEAGTGRVLTAIAVLDAEGCVGGAGIRSKHTVTLTHVDALGGGVAEEDFVELGANDLEGVGVAGTGLAEGPAPGVGVAAPDHGGAVLGEEAGGLDGGEDAKLGEDGHGSGEERLTDVLTGGNGRARRYGRSNPYARAWSQRRSRPVRRPRRERPHRGRYRRSCRNRRTTRRQGRADRHKEAPAILCGGFGR